MAVRHCFLLAPLFAAAFLAAAQWQPAGPVREEITGFTRDVDYLYAGSKSNRVYRSADGGRTWTCFTSGLEDGNKVRPVQALAAAGGVIVAGTDDGVYRSPDRGQT